VVFGSNRNKNFEERLQYPDLYIISINGGKERRIKTPAGPKWAPVFSPDGKYIAYRGRLYPDEWVGWRNIYLWMVPVRGGRAVNITKSFDRTFEPLAIDDLGHYAWSRPIFSVDGKCLYDTSANGGDVSLYRIDIKQRKVSKILGTNERIYALDHNGKSTFALAIANVTSPGNLHLLKDGDRKQLTNLDKNYVKAHRFARPEEVRWKGYKGDEIEGWLLKPPPISIGKRGIRSSSKSTVAQTLHTVIPCFTSFRFSPRRDTLSSIQILMAASATARDLAGSCTIDGASQTQKT
jgi:dipeptidyl aminopeptidase/acylaminoacyl peptidase